jgi:hypothetical protein
MDEPIAEGLGQAAANAEPWHSRHRLRDAIATVYAPRPAPNVVPLRARDQLYDFAARTIGSAPIRYLEFGVAGGKSMRSMTKRFAHPDARFFGFDCFEGIPEAWKDKPPGTFSMQGRLPVMADKRVSLVKGYFQDTLPEFISTFECPATGPVLVHYDADLYSSTLFILSTLWQRVSEYYFLFDEFVSDEIIALHDFMQAYPVDVEFLCRTDADLPPQIFGKLRRRTFAERLVISKESSLAQ